jgi:hypothetical protein
MEAFRSTRRLKNLGSVTGIGGIESAGVSLMAHPTPPTPIHQPNVQPPWLV